MKTLALAVLAVLALCAAGCSSTLACTTICTTQNGCSAATMRDCTALCGRIATISSGGNCSAQYDEYRICESAIVICSPSQSLCDDERAAWATCAGTYCAAHGTDANCAGGAPAL